jgi:hypothetical protein
MGEAIGRRVERQRERERGAEVLQMVGAKP